MKTFLSSFVFVMLFTVSGLAQVLSSTNDVYIISGQGITRIPAGYAVQFEVLKQNKGFDGFAKELRNYIGGSAQLYARLEAGEYKYRLGNFASEREAALLKKQIRAKTRYKDAWVVYDAGGMPGYSTADASLSAGVSPTDYSYVAPRSPLATAGPRAYAIQLGAYEVRPGPSDFKSLSNLGVIYAVQEGRLYKARLGGYPTKDAANKALAAVHKYYPKAYVVEDPNAAPLLNQPAAVAPTAYGQTGTYTVKKGDNLFRISQRTGVQVYRLREINNLPPNGTIRPGQVLRLQ